MDITRRLSKNVLFSQKELAAKVRQVLMDEERNVYSQH
jgi:hypothetical protein